MWYCFCNVPQSIKGEKNVVSALGGPLVRQDQTAHKVQSDIGSLQFAYLVKFK